MWVDVDNCQAGFMEGKGCLEQIFILKLCDHVQYNKFKSYILFVDYRKAYNKVPRSNLIDCLKSIGCGNKILRAIYVMHCCTSNILESSVGIRQGVPASFLLLVIYINQMICMLKDKIATDCFSGVLQSLLLMDDTVTCDIWGYLYQEI